jgi:hypothetical protein
MSSRCHNRVAVVVNWLGVCLIVFCQVAVSQVADNRSNPKAVCEVAARPDQLNSTTISIRGLALIAFEEFRLSAADCLGRKIDDIWLEYGRGPKSQPTTWCCGDLTPRDSLRLIQDKDFRDFQRKLTAHSGRERFADREKYLYDVTATLTGRFEAVPTEPCAGNSKAHCCPTGGFGHLGSSCARLVIRSVSNVVAKPR